MARKSASMARNNNGIKRIDNDTYVVGGGQALVQFGSTTRAQRETTSGKILVSGKSSKTGIAFWGKHNNLPDLRELLIAGNNIVPQLIKTKRNIILGTGEIIAYREVFEDGKKRILQEKIPTKIQQRLEDNEIEDVFLPKQVKNYLIHGNFYTEAIRGKGSKSKEIVKLTAKDSKYIRSGLQNTSGKVTHYYLSNSWTVANQNPVQKTKIVEVPAWDKDSFQPKFIMHCADTLLGGPYYYIPSWEGSWTWIKVANTIPEFHLSNLDNGFNIRYKITVPDGYWKKMLSDEQRSCAKAASFEKQKRDEFIKKLNKFFQGAKNSGKALVTTKYIFEHIQKTFQGVEIEPLEVDLKDEAMLKLFETTNSANTSAHGTPPALAGIATGAKMTSGSEILNLYNYFQTVISLHPRKLLFKPIMEMIKSMPDYDPDLKFGLEDVVLTQQNVDKSGKQTKTEDE